MNPHRIRQQLHRIAKSRLALSTVVTSLIILVIAVLLAGVVTYFAVNVTSTRAQEESLALTKQHTWIDHSTEKAQAAIMVINAGGRDVAIDKLTVRGQVCAWSKVYYTLIDGSVTGDLSYSSKLADGESISVGGQNRVFTKATNDLTVQSGKTLIIYMDNPDSISVNDVGLTVSVNIFTSQAMYYKETNVQGTSGTTTPGSTSTPTPTPTPTPDDPGTSNLIIQYAEAYYSSSGTHQIAVVVTNPTSSAASFNTNSPCMNGAQIWPSIDIIKYFYYGTSTLNSDLPYYTGQQIQTYTLSKTTAYGYTVNPGYSWIMYFTDTSIFGESDVGKTIGVSLTCSDGSTNTKYITIQQA